MLVGLYQTVSYEELSLRFRAGTMHAADVWRLRRLTTAPPPANPPWLFQKAERRMDGEVKAVYSLYRLCLRQVRRLPTGYLR